MTDQEHTFTEEIRQMTAEETAKLRKEAIRTLAIQTGLSEKAIEKALSRQSVPVFTKIAKAVMVKAEDTSIIGGAAYTLLTGDLNGLFPVAGGLFSKFTRRLGIPAGKLAYRRLKGSGSARTKN